MPYNSTLHRRSIRLKEYDHSQYKVSSLRDFGGDVTVVVRRLKPTVNKVLSLRDMSLQKRQQSKSLRSMPDKVKIGMTNCDTIDARLKELFNTSAPLPFECEYACKVSDCEKAKRMQVPQGRYFINRRCNLRTANRHHSPKSRRDDTYRLSTYKSPTS